MNFFEAIKLTRINEDCYKPGLQALGNNAQLIECKYPRRLSGSLDLDAALAKEMPNEPRWDYAIGLTENTSDYIEWVEIHPAASTSEVNTVLKKYLWLKNWLNNSAPSLKEISRKYVWVPTGRVVFSQGSPQRKRLASKGLAFSNSPYRIN